MRQSILGMAVCMAACIAAAASVPISAPDGGARGAYSAPPPAMEIGTPAPKTAALGPLKTGAFKSAAVSEPYIEAAAIPDGEKTSLGVFIVTAYCDCPKCCGKWSGHELSVRTQAGFPHPVEGYTVAVDPKIIPLRSVVELEGYGARYAHDTGGMIKGKRIDMFFTSHDDALKFGRRKIEVWIYK